MFPLPSALIINSFTSTYMQWIKNIAYTNGLKQASLSNEYVPKQLKSKGCQIHPWVSSIACSYVELHWQ